MLKCYRPNCKCDEIKKKYCLFRMNKKQFNIYKAIHQKEICPECGELTVNAKYKGIDIKLCTSCKYGLEMKYRGRKVC